MYDYRPQYMFYLLRFIVPVITRWLMITRNSSCRVFTLCVVFVCCYCIRWTNAVWIIFSVLSLDLVFVISQRLWWLVGEWSYGSWISVWFTSVTIRLSNRFCKFTGEGFFGDNELGDAIFLLFLDLVFTIFHSSVHLSFVISISITACWFLISFLRHWFSFSSILILSYKIAFESFLITLSSAN